jgi:hypothetical protein
VVGVAFIAMTRALLGQTLDAHIGNLRGARGMTALLVIGIMTVHSLTEGVALGVSFAGEESLGILIAIAISIHNIPEGVAVSLALVPFGESARSAAERSQRARIAALHRAAKYPGPEDQSGDRPERLKRIPCKGLLSIDRIAKPARS